MKEEKVFKTLRFIERILGTVVTGLTEYRKLKLDNERRSRFSKRKRKRRNINKIND